jgi:hypothetical protein
MLNQKLKQNFFYLIIAGVVIFLLFFMATGILIGNQVKKSCQQAQTIYQSDCVNSLILFLNDETQSFQQRNSAIWALGQLGDRRALPVLQKYYTGNIINKERLEKTISQYELKKAINLAEGGLNITAVFWRYGF